MSGWMGSVWCVGVFVCAVCVYGVVCVWCVVRCGVVCVFVSVVHVWRRGVMSDEYEWVVGAVMCNGFLITLGCVSVANYIIGLHCHDLPILHPNKLSQNEAFPMEIT